jgi:perosamine synthetase
MGFFEGEKYPVSERLSSRGFYIPSGLALNDDQITRVVDSFKEILK